MLVDSRPRWHPCDDERRGKGTVDEGDADAFVRLRNGMGRVGVDLVDAVVFDDQQHWWSLHELTSGTTTWAPPPRPPRT